MLPIIAKRAYKIDRDDSKANTKDSNIGKKVQQLTRRRPEFTNKLPKYSNNAFKLSKIKHPKLAKRLPALISVIPKCTAKKSDLMEKLQH